MSKTQNKKENQNIKQNENIINVEEIMEEFKMLQELDINPERKICKDEALDTLFYMISVMDYSLSKDLYVSVFSKSDRQELLNLLSKVENKLSTIRG